ncbi:recombinase family protein [Clostridium perfringens]|nr:recombinase family protein [Clostridium perfringens]MDK0793867.1 recombinase family protein [Clostridium perfringens]
MKKAAIYARKSKLTEKGDSIESQIKLCSKYLDNLGISDIYTYIDEGFSGKDIERPEFKKMLLDAESRKFDIIICYKLDRISRNVSDFSSLIAKLDRLNIAFISVIEQFDTSSAIGKAMMYICSVFSQLERETISQRITDNMYALATEGYWLGGEPPTGFKSKKNTLTIRGKQRTYSILVPIEEELELVKLIFSKYIEFMSLSQVEKYMLSNNIKTKRNKDWSKAALSIILKNPAYVKADERTFDYIKSTGSTVYGTPDGKHGLLIYKKHKGKKGEKHDISEWIYAISEHEGIINSEDWILVQKQLKKNSLLAPALGCSHTALLSGLIRCAKCNSPMKVAYGSKIPNSNKKKFYYVCTLKNKSGKTRCDNKNLPGLTLDELILNKLKEISLDKNILLSELNQYKKNMELTTQNETLKNIKNNISKNTTMIDNLLNNLALTTDSEITSILLDKISKLKDENNFLNQRIDDINTELSIQENLISDCTLLIEKLKHFSNFIDTASIHEQKKLVSSIVEKVLANGDTGSIEIKFKPLMDFKF